MNQKKHKNGFTLIELLVVMAILGILTIIGLSNFTNAQRKARDAQRKSDLGQVKRALEMYFNDYGYYPAASSGYIISSSYGWKTSSDVGAEFKDANTTYMKELPGDPVGSPQYCYVSTGSTFQIYATLENANDPQCVTTNCISNKSCGGSTYNYGVSSSNTTP